MFAINSIKKDAIKKKKIFTENVMTGQDPSVNIILMEDCAAVNQENLKYR